MTVLREGELHTSTGNGMVNSLPIQHLTVILLTGMQEEF
jgi:hypothetical protein